MSKLSLFFIAAAVALLATAGCAQSDWAHSKDDLRCDTFAVFVVYIDSVAIFSAYPEYDERIEVVPGWQVYCPAQEMQSRYFDLSGREMPEYRVLMTKRRKHKARFK